MSTEFISQSDRWNGIWNLVLIRDIFCNGEKEGRGFYAVLDYENDKSKKIYSDTVPIGSLVNKIVGNQYRREDKFDTLINDNVGMNRDVHIIDITESDISKYSKSFASYLGYDRGSFKEVKDEINPILKTIGLNQSVGYIGCHLIDGNDSNNLIEHYIIPSSEIMRFYFLKSSKFSSMLLSTLHSEKLNPLKVFEGVCEKINDDIQLDEFGKRVATLFVKQGFRRDIDILARIAYVDEAKKCLDYLRRSIYQNGLPEAGIQFRPLLTKIPQTNPFKMAVCGKEFMWRGKKYFIVSQIYDTDEILPYDKIMYSTLASNARMFEGKLDDIKDAQENANIKTSITPDTIVTHQGAGDGDGIGEIIWETRTGFSFSGKQVISQEKTSNTEEGMASQGFPTELVAKVMVTTALDGVDVDAQEGRANLIIKQIDPRTDRNPRRDEFIEAVKKQKYYKIRFLKGEDNTFIPETTFTKAKGEKTYNVLCCELQRKDWRVYLLRCDSEADDTSRFAIFHCPKFSELKKPILKKLHDQTWRFKGISRRPSSMGLQIEIPHYKMHNQNSLDVDALAKKIASELEEFKELRIKKYVGNS